MQNKIISGRCEDEARINDKPYIEYVFYVMQEGYSQFNIFWGWMEKNKNKLVKPPSSTFSSKPGLFWLKMISVVTAIVNGW